MSVQRIALVTLLEKRNWAHDKICQTQRHPASTHPQLSLPTLLLKWFIPLRMK